MLADVLSGDGRKGLHWEAGTRGQMGEQLIPVLLLDIGRPAPVGAPIRGQSVHRELGIGVMNLLHDAGTWGNILDVVKPNGIPSTGWRQLSPTCMGLAGSNGAGVVRTSWCWSSSTCSTVAAVSCPRSVSVGLAVRRSSLKTKVVHWSWSALRAARRALRCAAACWR